MSRLAPVHRQDEVEPGGEHVVELALVRLGQQEAVVGGVRRHMEPALETPEAIRVGQVVPVEVVGCGQKLLRAEAAQREIDPGGTDIRPRLCPEHWTWIARRSAGRQPLKRGLGCGKTNWHGIGLPWVASRRLLRKGDQRDHGQRHYPENCRPYPHADRSVPETARSRSKNEHAGLLLVAQ